MKIGPSTGWLFAVGVFDTGQQERFIKASGANIFEICLDGWADKRTTALTRSKFGSETVGFRSIHLPPITDRVPDISHIQHVIDHQKPNVAVAHLEKVGADYPIAVYEMLQHGLRPLQVDLAIENMDKSRDSGIRVEDIVQVAHSVDLKFVLDVQHAYEEDPSMKYANDLYEGLEDRLSHLHVSGESQESNHCLLHRSSNSDAILGFLETVLARKSVSLILEGEYKTVDDLSAEISFLRKNLNQ